MAYNFVGTWIMRKPMEIGSSVPELITAVENLKLLGFLTRSRLNIVADSCKTNGGGFETVPDESAWNLC